MNELANRLKERLIAFISTQGLTKAKFEKKCGLSNGYINNFKGNLGSKKLEAVLSAFPELSRDWLLFGEGEMLKPSAVDSTVMDSHDTNSSHTINRLLGLLEEKDKQIAEKDKQLQTLLALLEK